MIWLQGLKPTTEQRNCAGAEAPASAIAIDMLSYEQARQKVIEQVGKKRGLRASLAVSV